jgi:hypothetical protein
MEQEFNLQLVYWDDIRSDVQTVNQEFTKLIDALSPDKRYPLIKASYRYGDSVVQNGVTYLPTPSLALLPITDPFFKKEIKDYLTYSSIPLFLTLKNANEVYMHSAQRTVPLNLFYPGSLLGLFESLDMLYGRPSAAKWSVSAGARNIFMLPKLNEKTGFKRLRIAYDLDIALQPRHLFDHWQLFRAIAGHKDFIQPWQNEILFFTKNWLLSAKNDPAWMRFKDYLVGKAWEQGQIAISKIGLDITWERFAEAIDRRNLKPIPYLVDHVKHILLVSLGRWPAFKVADHLTSVVAPMNGLQQAMTEIYHLKKYLPTFLHMSNSDESHNIPLYYSLSFPTLLEGLPHRTKNTSTFMIDIRNIKQIIDTLMPVFDQLDDNEASRFKEICFEYFHVEPDPYGEILSSQQLPILDSAFLAAPSQFQNRIFCTTSQFWRGTVRISRGKAG